MRVQGTPHTFQTERIPRCLQVATVRQEQTEHKGSINYVPKPSERLFKKSPPWKTRWLSRLAIYELTWISHWTKWLKVIVICHLPCGIWIMKQWAWSCSRKPASTIAEMRLIPIGNNWFISPERELWSMVWELGFLTKVENILRWNLIKVRN